VFAALAEFERNLIRERTLAGLSAARARGRVGGRKPKLSEKQIREIKTLLTDPAAQVNDIAQRYGVSRTTLYKRVGVVQPLTNLKGIVGQIKKIVSIEEIRLDAVAQGETE
jgi:DNA invertase Pin-like site-specific DNA recombinase